VIHPGIEANPMSKSFKRGDRVEWNSEAGRVRGVIVKKIVSDVRVKGYVHHASKDEPQYIIKSEKTDHVAIHKGPALRDLKSKKNMKPKKTKARRKTR
jgi:Hypervirulence associated proteins TUDOR domain